MIRTKCNTVSRSHRHYFCIWVTLPCRNIMHKFVIFSQSLDNQYSKAVDSGGLIPAPPVLVSQIGTRRHDIWDPTWHASLMGQISQEVYLVKKFRSFSNFRRSVLKNGRLWKLNFPMFQSHEGALEPIKFWIIPDKRGLACLVVSQVQYPKKSSIPNVVSQLS